MKKRNLLVSFLCLMALVGVSATTLTSCKTEKDPVQETEKYTVTFDSKGGTAVAKKEEVVKGSKITAPTPPTKANFTFDGWYKDSNCTQVWKFEIDVVEANITLYAKWTENEPVKEYWTVTIDLNDGSTPTTKQVEKGQKLTGVSAPTREGYTFAGWKANDVVWTMEETITANITIVAQWTENEPDEEYWTVTIDLNDGSTPTTKQVVKGEKLTGVSSPTRTGYIFAGWKANDVAWTMEETITADITIVAQWTAVYSITYVINGHGTQPENLTDQTKLPDSLPVLTQAGWTFGGWYTDEGLQNAAEAGAALSANATLYAKWTENVYSITYVINGHGTQPENLTDQTKLPDSLPELSQAGWTFDGWYTDEGLQNEAEAGATLSANTTLYAKWTGITNGKVFMNGTEYATIKAAFAAIPTTSTDTYTITLGKGTFNENGLSYKGSATIRLVGSTDAKYGSDVIIRGHGSVMPGQTGTDSKKRCLISIQGTANIILENLTLESDWSRAEHPGDAQAEVLGTDTTGNTAAYNCGFKSHQDTLRTIGKAWFYGCYIEGDVDFIWMEAGGKVALYENCEIVSVYDSAAGTHRSYITAPKMAETLKLGKGLVIFNSIVKESDEAKENGQQTYLARTPWNSGCYNQVAYINTKCEGIELGAADSAGPWYGNQIATPYPKTTVGWKMDKATADSIGITGTKDYILDAATVAKEFNGRNAILNRMFDTGKLRYVTDTSSNWDINAFITAMGWSVVKDTSSDKLEDDTMGVPTIYNFRVAEVPGAVCNGFALQQGKTHYVGQAGATITIPVNGKCYVEVYGYYSGTVEATADTQAGKMIMFFNNASTNNEVENDCIVYDENASSFILTARATTYITQIVVIPDSGIEDRKVETLTIKEPQSQQLVGVPLTLQAEIGPKGVNNTSVLWSSSDESVATVDPYSGKVTFLAEGQVTITATACDGSNKSASIQFSPIVPNWTAIEWYTKDTEISEENGADGIEMFNVNSSANKKLSKTYTFTNLAGQIISTNYGLKLNSSGKLSFATLKYAEVYIMVAPQQNNLVNPPAITNADGSKATLLSQHVDETTGVQYFTYALNATGMWDIERSETTAENNPILYAKVEYKESIITESTGITFKGTTYTESNTGIGAIFTPSTPIDASSTTVEINKMNFTNCASNGSASNWLKFNTGAKIEFKVDRATTLFVGYYSKLQTVKLDGVVVEGDKTSVSNGTGEIVTYEITAGGTVTIEATTNDFLGFVGVLFKTLDQKKADACSSLDKAYPANKYTQNADYETVLAAQKAAINSAEDEAALAIAIASAKTALDALEQDPVVEYPQTLNYVFASLANKPADGAQVESTDSITFTNCVAHNGQYVALKDNNEVRIKIAAGSTLTVSMPYSSGVTLNGEAYTLVDNNLVYVASEDTEVIITGTAGNSYIETIVITKSPVYAEKLNYVFASLADKPADGVQVESTDSITFTNCVAHNGQYVALKNDNEVKIRVAAGSTLTVSMPYSSGVTLNGEAYTLVDDKLVYVASEDTEVIITGTAGNSYIETIIITKSPVYAQTLNYVFASLADKPADGAQVESTESITFTNCVVHNGQYVALKNDNEVKIRVAAGSTLTVSMPYSSGVTLNGEAYTLVDNNLVYVASEDTEVIITGTAGNSYIESIVITTE